MDTLRLQNAEKRVEIMTWYNALRNDLDARYNRGRISWEDYTSMLKAAEEKFQDQYYEHYHYRDEPTQPVRGLLSAAQAWVITEDCRPSPADTSPRETRPLLEKDYIMYVAFGLVCLFTALVVTALIAIGES